MRTGVTGDDDLVHLPLPSGDVELQRAVLAEARRRGCALVQLTTDKARTDAHSSYGRLGFIASHEGLKLEL